MKAENEETASETTPNGPLHHPETKHPSPVDAGTSSTDGADPAHGNAGDGVGGEQAFATEPQVPEPQRLHRVLSAPPDLLKANTKALLSKEEEVNRLNPVGEGRSLSNVSFAREQSPSRITTQAQQATPEPPTLGNEEDVSNEAAFEEFINSPIGQIAIVERSPGGRYVRFNEKLGAGASKEVYRAYDTQEGIEVAWNVVQLSGVPKAERNRIVNEVRLLERLHHPNIISFHGSWVNRERQEVNFVTEILSSGTLTSFIEKVQVIRWKIAKRWAFQILKGLEYLHSQDPPVIHRDLKCENIFINGTSGDLRIGDLGLSTVQTNGKVLSVLGTPEFMAPDLYEEAAYDEKVDIYAFGMCLLEILTKEIPYRECNNPAQIYKKVMKGEKPESLERLRSKMARDFVNLCLGYKDEATGKYVRPTAAELLTNPFLAKSADDDSEVKVDPPLSMRIILEEPVIPPASRSQVTARSQVMTKSQVSANSQVSATGGDSGASNEALPEEEHQAPLPLARRRSDTPSVEDDSDHFEEMPDSEVNIRKVKVYMGRNEEWKEEHAPPPPVSDASSAPPEGTLPIGTLDNILPSEGEFTPGIPQISSHQSLQQLQQLQPGFESGHHRQFSQNSQQFLFGAAVIEDESASMPHYQDDILKLIITLPVDGQTQNVQFDFHLVEDDPVQVAKEMVEELSIPHEATLEIGATISALARQARMKQGVHRNQVQAQIQTVQANALFNGNEMMPHQPQAMYQQQQQAAVQPQVVQPHMNQPPPQANQIPPQVNQLSAETHVGHQIVQPQPSQVYQEKMQLNGIYQGHDPATGHSHFPPIQMESQSSELGNDGGGVNFMYQQPLPAQDPPREQKGTQQAGRYVQDQQQGQTVNPSAAQQSQPVERGAGVDGQVDAGVLPLVSNVPQPQAGVQDLSNEVGQPSANLSPATSVSPVPPQVIQPNVLSSSVISDVTLQDQPQFAPENQSALKVDMALESLGDMLRKEEEEEDDDDDDDDEGDDDEVVKEELRRLEENYQKNLMRAQKVFDNRMDNLQRSKLEKEALHKKTLQKHEKERIEFEKRVQQEELEQSQRIEKIQREWEEQRQLLGKVGKGKKKHYQHAGLSRLQSGSSMNTPLSASPEDESFLQNANQQMPDNISLIQEQQHFRKESDASHSVGEYS
jgi:WNK lysine deficient protein kinase